MNAIAFETPIFSLGTKTIGFIQVQSDLNKVHCHKLAATRVIIAMQLTIRQLI